MLLLNVVRECSEGHNIECMRLRKLIYCQFTQKQKHIKTTLKNIHQNTTQWNIIFTH